MLEAQLLVRLGKVQGLLEGMWDSDAEVVWREAIALSADSPYEESFSYLEKELRPSLEWLTEQFLRNHNANALAIEVGGTLWAEFNEFLRADDRQDRGQWRNLVESLIGELTQAIGDKIHRRNLQIADLKQKLENAERHAKVGTK